MIAQWNLGSLFQISDMAIVSRVNRNACYFVGMDDPEKIKSITFETGPLTAVWCEEATELNREDVEQLNLRLRGQAPVPFQMTLTFNPVSVHHWIKGWFYDDPPPGVFTMVTTWKDNRFLDEGYKKQLQNLKGTAHRVYTLGEWGVTEGLVYQDFTVAEVPKDARLVARGLDFGFSSDPLALIDVYEAGPAGDPTSIWMDERIYETNLTNSDLIRRMNQMELSKHVDIIEIGRAHV